MKCFSGENFENSTALVITFTVLNTKNDEFQEMALEWEKEFLKLISTYTSENITISYSAEVITSSSFTNELALVFMFWAGFHAQSEILVVLTMWHFDWVSIVYAVQCFFFIVKSELEINMHYLRGNAIPAGPLSYFLSNFYKIRWGCPSKLHGRGFKNVDLQMPKSPKYVIFGINLPQRGIFS